MRGQACAVGTDDLKFVFHIIGKARKEYLPNARAYALAHHVAAAVPVVEIANHADALRVRRPNRKNARQ